MTLKLNRTAAIIQEMRDKRAASLPPLADRVEALVRRLAIEQGLACEDDTTEACVTALENQGKPVATTPTLGGHVEIFDVYDHRFYEVFIDGYPFCPIEKKHFMQEISKSSLRASLADAAGVKPDDLRYTVYDIYTKADKDPNYDANDYNQAYQACVDAVARYNVQPWPNKVDIEYLEKICW